MDTTFHCMRNAMGDGSSFTCAGASKNRYWSRDAFRSSTLLVVKGVKNVGHRPEGHLFGRGEVGLRSQRLLREGPERPKESDALDACARHSRQRRGSRSSSGTMIR